ncbi:MAG: hypothetical protein D4R64_13175 [Porphyromonadaceae bacterium]|nr:MAG: hypothetical protein D4R64_13175 [Porphyromonadaceae bacterium]
MTQNDTDAIISWLNSGRDYNAGVALFEKYSRNQALKRIFPNKEARFAFKLAYELEKLIPSNRKPEQPEPAAPKPSGLKPVTTGSAYLDAINDDDPNLPKVIRQIISEYSTVYNQRSILHNSLKKIAPDNRPDNVESRRIIVEQISELSDRMEELYEAHQLWIKEKTLPDDNRLFPVKKLAPIQTEVDAISDLVKRRMNLMKSLSKDNNLLAFGSTTKLPTVNEMRDGPKRNALEKRILKKKTEIATLSAQIDGLNKVL